MVAAWRRQPLRVRLVLALTSVLLFALTLIGALSLTLIRQALVAEVDDRLTSAANALVQSSFGAIASGITTQNDLIPSEYAVLLASPDGTSAGSVVTSEGSPDVSLALDDVLAAGGDPRTAPSVDGGQRWRVVTSPLYNANGDVALTVAVALPLDSVDDTIRRLLTGLLAAGLGVLIAGGAATYLIVRASLRPLHQIEATAAAIADGDLTQRIDDPPPATTEVGSLANSLNKMLADIEESFEIRRASEARMQRFVGDASHELRTPLAAMAGYTELYRMGGIPPEGVSEVMGRIEDSTARMSRLVADLLTLARMDRGAQPDLSRTQVEPLLTGAASELRALDSTRDVSVQSPPLTVMADPDRLAQVLTNLVGNAAAYAPAGTPVELHGHREGDRVIIECRDHGAGIPQQDRERIFERFARLDAGRARDDGGSGLGLAIARANLAAMDGEISAVETQGGGTTMRIVLPGVDEPPTNGVSIAPASDPG